jgi:hypothetical protein
LTVSDAVRRRADADEFVVTGARRLAEHHERSGFLVMMRPPIAGGANHGGSVSRAKRDPMESAAEGLPAKSSVVSFCYESEVSDAGQADEVLASMACDFNAIKTAAA